MSAPDWAVAAENVGRVYNITTRAERTIFKSFLRSLQFTYSKEEKRPLVALRDVSFNVKRGEVFGIIGPNGAGKTTLLMILAGILKPTTGEARVAGRMSCALVGLNSALLAELTVEENIRLSAALLGISKRKLDECMEAILDFGELAPYRYARLNELSTGYQARMMFSTLIHIESDIILLDEVLAVGDEQFTSKCKAAIKKFVEGGKTLIYVSHSMPEVRTWCDRCLYLNGGHMRALGPTAEVVGQYLKECRPSGARGFDS